MINEGDRKFQALLAAEDPGSRPGVFSVQTEGLRVHQASGDGRGGRIFDPREVVRENTGQGNTRRA